MRLPTALRLVAPCSLACAAAMPVVPAQAQYDQPPTPVFDQATFCAGDAYAAQAAANAESAMLNATLSPSDGASVLAGAPVSFAGYSSSPLTFSLASAPSLLTTPDIDHGTGFGFPITGAFVSNHATAKPGTVYWTASFTMSPNADSCNNPPIVYTTSFRTLTVTAPPPPAVQVSINAPGGFALAHSTVTFQIHCTTSCSGDAYYQVLVMRRHAKPDRRPTFDLLTTPVSITAPAGGDLQVTRRYSGRSLQMLKAILRTRAIVQLQLSVKVTDPAGNTARTNSSAHLHA